LEQIWLDKERVDNITTWLDKERVDDITTAQGCWPCRYDCSNANPYTIFIQSRLHSHYMTVNV